MKCQTCPDKTHTQLSRESVEWYTNGGSCVKRKQGTSHYTLINHLKYTGFYGRIETRVSGEEGANLIRTRKDFVKLYRKWRWEKMCFTDGHRSRYLEIYLHKILVLSKRFIIKEKNQKNTEIKWCRYISKAGVLPTYSQWTSVTISQHSAWCWLPDDGHWT